MIKFKLLATETPVPINPKRMKEVKSILDRCMPSVAFAFQDVEVNLTFLRNSNLSGEPPLQVTDFLRARISAPNRANLITFVARLQKARQGTYKSSQKKSKQFLYAYSAYVDTLSVPRQDNLKVLFHPSNLNVLLKTLKSKPNPKCAVVISSANPSVTKSLENPQYSFDERASENSKILIEESKTPRFDLLFSTDLGLIGDVAELTPETETSVLGAVRRPWAHLNAKYFRKLNPLQRFNSKRGIDAQGIKVLNEAEGALEKSIKACPDDWPAQKVYETAVDLLDPDTLKECLLLPYYAQMARQKIESGQDADFFWMNCLQKFMTTYTKHKVMVDKMIEGYHLEQERLTKPAKEASLELVIHSQTEAYLSQLARLSSQATIPLRTLETTTDNLIASMDHMIYYRGCSTTYHGNKEAKAQVITLAKHLTPFFDALKLSSDDSYFQTICDHYARMFFVMIPSTDRGFDASVQMVPECSIDLSKALSSLDSWRSQIAVS